MWKIHGKVYDLTSFMDKHPGGRKLLEASKGDEDVTATFESYHALSDMKKIKSIMKKYEIGTCEPSAFSFDEKGFYRTLQRRVRALFKHRYGHKSNMYWCAKTCIQMVLFVASFYVAFCTYVPVVSMLSSILCGHMYIQLGFCVMHDASHNGISRYGYVNEYLSLLWNTFAFWDSDLWSRHHSFRHHAFTGDHKLDPDIIHYKPFFRKDTDQPDKKYLKIPKPFVAYVYLFFTCIFPGQCIGQAIVYLKWVLKGYVWKMSLPDSYRYATKRFQICVQALFLIFLLHSSIPCTILYMISLNVDLTIPGNLYIDTW